MKDTLHAVPESAAHQPIHDLDDASTLEEELQAMVESLKMMDPGATPDLMIQSCMAYMARCTEIALQLVRIEGQDRRAKVFRITQLERVTQLIEFEFKGASRLVEFRRQEIDLSR